MVRSMRKRDAISRISMHVFFFSWVEIESYTKIVQETLFPNFVRWADLDNQKSSLTSI